ncbi:MAG: hypothetical protein R3343_08255, partial [Nitriliruptorales bacterium]|nr:hypothetical protein [Nitriliruptorales bacterium]
MRSLVLVVVGAVLLLAAFGTRVAVPAELADLVADVEISADPHNALRGTLTVTTRAPTRLAVDISGEDHGLVVAERRPPATTHEIPLLQLLPNTTYDLRVTVARPDGAPVATGSVGSFTTGGLPDDLPPVTVDAAHPDRMTPGLTLFNSVYR